MTENTHLPKENTTFTSQQNIACDGGPATGHPRIYLDTLKNGQAVCPYCSRVFVYQP
jgi:uncharacterized Zn-finger protein